jgi:dipeptidyl aminopeptidase/acylaminoacyl peptidase
MPKYDIVFSELGRGVAYIAEKDRSQRVVHNGKPGKSCAAISHLTISPDGQRVSYSCTLGNYLQMVSDGVESAPFVDVYDAVYSPDSRHIAYLAQGIDKAMNIILDKKTIEVAAEVVTSNFLFTQDSAKLVYYIRPAGGHDAHLVIFDLQTGLKTVKKCLDTPMVMNSARDRIAVAAMEGDMQLVMDFAVSAPDDVHKSGLYDEVSNISIGGAGKGVAFVGTKGKHRYLVLDGKEVRIPDGLIVYDNPAIRPDMKGAGIILSTNERHNRRFRFLQSYHDAGSKMKQYGQIAEPVYSTRSSATAYVAMEGGRYFIVLNGKEGPSFDSIVTPMFSPDGSKLVYRAREGAKRFVVVADTAGKEHRRQPGYEMVFPTAFTTDDRSVAYGVKDGNQLVWKVENL